MYNKRIEQLAFMFAEITGKSKDESKKIILETNTGKAIRENNITVLYEQQTENIYSIAMELCKLPQYDEIVPLLSVGNIIASMGSISNFEKDEKNKYKNGFKMGRNPRLKSEKKKNNLALSNNALQLKKQNQLNAFKIELKEKTGTIREGK